MNTIQKKFMSLLNAALHQGKLPTSTLSYKELCTIQRLSHIHNLDALIFSAFDAPQQLRSTYPSLIKPLEKMMVFSALKQKMNYLQFQEILQNFLDAHLSIIPLKGVYLRNLYPQPDFRTMGDIDLLIHSEDYKQAKTILLDLNYNEVPDNHPFHKAFIHPKLPSIELHWSLTDAEHFNAKELLDFQNKVWQHAILESVGPIKALSLSHEDTCIYLIIHMANHLKYTGFGLRQICDLYLLLNQYGTHLNWNYIHQELKNLGLYPFFSLLITTLHILFNLPLTTIPLSDLISFNPKITSFFINEIFQNGVFGTDSYAHSMSSLLIHGEKNRSSKRPTQVKDFLFPPTSKLQERYLYCQKNALLLPIAWLQNLLNLLFRKDVSFVHKLQALLFSNRNKKKRLQLFKSLEL